MKNLQTTYSSRIFIGANHITIKTNSTANDISKLCNNKYYSLQVVKIMYVLLSKKMLPITCQLILFVLFGIPVNGKLYGTCHC